MKAYHPTGSKGSLHKSNMSGKRYIRHIPMIKGTYSQNGAALKKMSHKIMRMKLKCELFRMMNDV